MPPMCKECGVRPSQIHFTEIVNNNVVSTDLCAECAETRGIDVTKTSGGGLGDLVASLIDTTAESDAEAIGKVRCPTCGFNYSEFRRVGRFGCPDCYSAFERQLIPLLRQIHGSTRHSGKQPADLTQPALRRRELAELRGRLDKAVHDEDYETAAEMRDRIKELEESDDDSGND